MGYPGRADGRDYYLHPAALKAPNLLLDAGKSYARTVNGVTHYFYLADNGIEYQLTPNLSILEQQGEYWLDPINGNDANDGLGAATAVATYDRLFALVPKILAAPLILKIMGTAAWAECPKFIQLTDDACIIFQGVPETLVATHVCDAGTDATQITVAGPLVINTYQSLSMEVVDGPAAGYRRIVMSNTATSIIPLARYGNFDESAAVTPLAGNTVRIFRPGALITGISSVTKTMFKNLGNGDAGAPIILQNLELSDTDGVCIDTCTVYMAGVLFTLTNTVAKGTIRFNRCWGSFGNWSHYQRFYVPIMPNGSEDSNAGNLIKAGWLGLMGYTADLAQLAKWRGWGIGSPDSKVVSTQTGCTMAFINCTMSGYGVWAANLRVTNCYMLMGGYYWGGLSADVTAWRPIGRGDWNNNIPGSCVHRASITLNTCNWFSWGNIECDVVTAALILSQSYYLGGGQTNSYIQSGTNQSVISCRGSSYCQLNYTPTAISGNNSNAAVGLVHVENNSFLTYTSPAGVLTLTNAGTGHAIRIMGASGGKFSSPNSIYTVPGAGILVEEGSSLDIAGNVTGKITTLGGGSITHKDGNLSITSAIETPLQITEGAFYQAPNRTFSSVCTAPASGRGIEAGVNSRVSLRGGANTTAQGFSGGIRVIGGSSCWFKDADPAPANITNLQTGILAAVPTATVAGVGSATGDAYGNVIGRAA